MSGALILTDDASLIGLVENVLADRLDLANVDVSFQEWPTLKIELKGDKFNQSLTPTVMAVLVEIQRAINRTVAISLGYEHAGQLPKDVRDKLESEIFVTGGSTGLLQHLGKTLNALKEVLDGMESKHKAAVMITITAVVGGYFWLTSWLDAEAEIKKIEKGYTPDANAKQVLEYASESQRQNVKLMERFFDKFETRNVAEAASEVNRQAVKAVGHAESGKVNGVAIDAETARRLTREERRVTRPDRIDGKFRILKIDVTKSDEVRFYLEDMAVHRCFWATMLNEDWPVETRGQLGDGSLKYFPVNMTINVEWLGEKITYAKIVKAEVLKPE